MSGGEIIGDIAQGALAARAVEPDHGEATAATHGSDCLNCGTVLIGHHCHSCGQAAHVHNSLGAFLHDFVHGVFHFEGKVWRTLPALALRPGAMTREYIDGRRASYVSPIALFLFCVFLMFAVVKNFGIDLTQSADVDVNGKHIVGLEANKAEIARLEALRASYVAKGEPTDAIDGEIEGRRSGIAAIEAMKNPVKAVASQTQSGKSVIQSDVSGLQGTFNKARENPQLTIYKLQSNAYKFAWLLIPISVPFVWLLFPFNRRFGLYDHTVFVTYSLCFMMLLVTLVTLGAWAGVPLMATAMALIAPLHISMHVKGTYGLARWGAAWRTVALCSYAVLALIVFTIFVVLLGAGG